MEEITGKLNAFPTRIKVGNRSVFISDVLDKWAYDNDVGLNFSRTGKPTDKLFIESFNGSSRDDCLNVNWFLSLEDAQAKFDKSRENYNYLRPHSPY